jgi:hypothetical protein
MDLVSEAIIDEEVRERVIEMGFVARNVVVLVRVGLLPEQDVVLFQSCTQKHRVLVVDIVVLQTRPSKHGRSSLFNGFKMVAKAYLGRRVK